MTEKIQLVCDDISAALATIPGVEKAPANPTGRVGDMWLLTFPDKGYSQKISSGYAKTHPDIATILFCQFDDLARATVKLTPYFDLIPRKLYQYHEAHSFSTITTFENIHLQMIQIPWGGKEWWALRAVVMNVLYQLSLD